MAKQSWTIGSDPSCDIVVNSPTVSGRHCRLHANGDSLTLVDLDSTNGTFVNGRRLSGSRSIAPSDRITLGQTLTMPWPEGLERPELPAQVNQPRDQAVATTSQVITLGRGADNTIVLSESNVSTHHARLVIEGEEMVLEDLGSTNGTSLGSVENKISRVRVQAGDTIFLGSTPYQVSDLIRQTQPTYVKVTHDQATHGRAAKSTAGHPAGLAAIGGGVLIALLLGWLVMRNRDTVTPEQTVVSSLPSRVSVPQAAPELVSVPVTEEHASSRVEPERSPPAAIPDAVEPATMSVEQRLAQSLFVIVASDPDRKTPFRIGTGFAIDSQHVVTSASVVQAMLSLRENGFPNAMLYSPATSGEWKIASAKTHPRYELANQAARQAQDAHDAIFDDLESEPPRPEAFEAVKEQLIEARLKALQAIDLKTSYDVAVLSVDQPLAHSLPGIDTEASMRPNQKLRVVGYAFDVEDPFFDRSIPIEISTMTARVGQLIRSAEGAEKRLSRARDLSNKNTPTSEARRSTNKGKS